MFSGDSRLRRFKGLVKWLVKKVIVGVGSDVLPVHCKNFIMGDIYIASSWIKCTDWSQCIIMFQT